MRGCGEVPYIRYQRASWRCQNLKGAAGCFKGQHVPCKEPITQRRAERDTKWRCPVVGSIAQIWHLGRTQHYILEANCYLLSSGRQYIGPFEGVCFNGFLGFACTTRRRVPPGRQTNPKNKNVEYIQGLSCLDGHYSQLVVFICARPGYRCMAITRPQDISSSEVPNPSVTLTKSNSGE